MAVVTNADGRKNCIDGARRTATTSCCSAAEVAVAKRSTLLGTQVYFYLPHPYKGRSRTDSKRWCKPAVILAVDGPAENWRYASAEEAMAADAVAKTPGVGSEEKF